MNSENSKVLEKGREGKGKNVALSNLSINCTWKNIKKPYKNNRFKISAPTWIEKFDPTDGLYFVSDIQYCFQKTWKKDW